MRLAMTSIAVSASICASTSEAALLVASFMPFSLDPGVTRRGAKTRDDGLNVYSEHPTTSIRTDFESPLGEYRRRQNRLLIRRQFDSRVSGLANVCKLVCQSGDLLAFHRAAEFFARRCKLLLR